MMRRVLSPVGAVCAVLALMCASAHAAPVSTTSRYVQTTNYNTLYNEGCSMGGAGVSGVVVLDFGQPWDQNGVHGFWTLGGFWASPSQVQSTAEAFLDGFWNCSGPSPFLHLAVGENNYGSAVNTAAGQTLADVVNALNSYISSKGYGKQEVARGAFDAEPGWNSYAATASQVNGYGSSTSTYYYDFGSADGCPPFGNCSNNWGDSGLWYIAWGAAPAFTLPEIYVQNMATEWYTMSLFSYNNESNGKDQFLGAMTEYAADSSTFTPAQGFNALQNAINGDSRTAWAMTYSTDITWAQ